MATFTVTNQHDSGTESLRQAIIDANNTEGADEIVFSFVSGTITLTTGQLYITDSLRIAGSGANNLYINGNNKDRVFYIYNIPHPDERINVTLDGLTITNGSAFGGGGISNRENLIITNSSITKNVGNTGGEEDGIGGGINNLETGTLTLTNSTVSENSAFSGGGINNDKGKITIINSTISGNKAVNQGKGGGINNGGFNNTVNITSSTIADNIGSTGGGVYSSKGNLTITNTIISRNSGGNIINKSNLTESNNILEDSDGLKLGDLDYNGGSTRTHALGEGSIAINQGNNEFANGITKDQRGQNRFSDEIVDIGAFEFQAVSPPPEFDAAQYGASYGDLITAFGYNLRALTEHYLTNGMAEGRSPDRFDEFRYIASSYVGEGDLINVYGLNGAAATEHYIRYGYKENRSLTAFDPARYIDSYDDLYNAPSIGTNTLAATKHFITNGFSPPESRNPNLFASDHYLASYTDLINAFGSITDYAAEVEAASNHYLIHGRGEMRSITFDPEAYRLKNVDVATDSYYGASLERATEHYIVFGHNEERMTM